MNSSIFCRKTLLSGVLFLFVWIQSSAQIPEGVPQPGKNTKLDLTSTTNIILYIVIPVLLIGGYLIMRNRRRKRNKRKDNE